MLDSASKCSWVLFWYLVLEQILRYLFPKNHLENPLLLLGEVWDVICLRELPVP